MHAVCYLDLDQFKIINDTCGHIAGDELLRQLAHVLQGRVRSNDTLARLGGDEFGLLLHDCRVEDAELVANGLLKAVEHHAFVWGNNTFSVGASIGLVPVTATFRRVTQVLQAADAACYAAKDQGRNRIHVYQEDDTLVTQRHGEMQWVARVKRALNDNRFFLEAQPIVPLQGDREAKRNYELLVRMRDESGRVVPPGAFLPAVERYNLIARRSSACRESSSTCPAIRWAIRSCRTSFASPSSRWECRPSASASRSRRRRPSAISRAPIN
jgi:diguanylate cyclase (GGDEF)-like protein